MNMVGWWNDTDRG